MVRNENSGKKYWKHRSILCLQSKHIEICRFKDMKMIDNPHYVTPDEAEKMGCCMSMNRPEFAASCIGKTCMAWRWAEHFSIVMSNGIVTHKNSVGYSKTHGYCGMVRS